MWERRNDTRPVPCDDDGMFSRASLMEGWTRDETGSCYAVKGDVDACDPPPEARVPRLDRCCYEQKVGYGRHATHQKCEGSLEYWYAPRGGREKDNRKRIVNGKEKIVEERDIMGPRLFRIW